MSKETRKKMQKKGELREDVGLVEVEKKIVVIENGGIGGVQKLDPNALLIDVRKELESEDLMTPDQSFMFFKKPLQRKNEETTSLSEILETKDGAKILTVGEGSVSLGEGPDASHKMWTEMSVDQKVKVMNKVVLISKGISISVDDGAFKTTHDAIKPLTNKTLPKLMTSTVLRKKSKVKTDAYFSKYAESLATSSTKGGSLSVSTPWGGGSTSFSHAESHFQSSSEYQTWYVGTYNVYKVVVELERTKLELTDEFYQELLTAVGKETDADQFVGIVEALNKYGWYVPTKMNLGGMLYTEKQSKVSTWAQADSESNSFSADFKASFDGIGGGASYNQSDTSETKSSGAQGSKSLTFTAIGGNPAYANDYSKWTESLENASSWNVSSYETLIPSVALLMNNKVASAHGPQLAAFIRNVIANQYANSPELGTLQPLIDCNKYSLRFGELMYAWDD